MQILATTRFFLLLCVAAFAPRARAQSQEIAIPDTGQMVPVCKLADLDSKVSFYSAGAEFIVAFDLKNISESACVPQPDDATLHFGSWGAPEAEQPFAVRVGCQVSTGGGWKTLKLCSPNQVYGFHPPVVLNPGEIAHQTYRWKTVAPAKTVKCARPNALWGPVSIYAPALLAQVCSEITVSQTRPGAFVPPAPEHEPRTYEPNDGELFVLSSRKSHYYQGDFFNLHVGLANPADGSPSGEKCPTLFLRQRSPDGRTRLDEVRPTAFKGCKTFTLGANRSMDWQSGFDVDSGATGRWTGIGKHSFQLFEAAGYSGDGKIEFVHSNKLTVKIDDPALIPRKWLGKAKGVGVDVTLDKYTYRLGEDVPLHIAIENFDAPVPIYSIDPTWDLRALGIKVRDAAGRTLPEYERSPSGVVLVGGGPGPRPYPPGKLEPVELTLAGIGWLPNRPGIYTVVVTWSPYDGTGFEAGPGVPRKEKFKTYTTVQAATTFRVVGKPLPAPRSKP